MDGHASPLFLLRALHQSIDYRPNHEVVRIDPAPHSFRIHCGAETFHAPKIVIAAGLGSRDLAPLVGLEMPVSPLQGQIIVTERVGHLLDHPTHTLRQTPEGTVMMGDSQEDVGFDISTRVAVLKQIADRNTRVFPALKDANIVRMWAALRVMSPDGFPIYEQSERYPGAFSATCHSGVTLAGAHALALAPAIVAGDLPVTLAAFHSQRFRPAA
jgi:glycine/D-amino acid oxidase-like deaminating enzyme